MRNSLVLIDTHILLWWFYAPYRLNKHVMLHIVNPDTQVHVSAISLWEISIKLGLGKLPHRDLQLGKLMQNLNEMEIPILELTAEDAIGSISLSSAPHKDPFDRMLAWQAISRRLVMVSADDSMAVFEPFGLKRFIPTDTDFLLNEEIEAYNAMIEDD